MEVSLHNIQCLLEAVNKIPEMTPKRWELISELVRGSDVGDTSINLTMQVCGGNPGCSIGCFNAKHCQDLYKILEDTHSINNCQCIQRQLDKVCASSDAPGLKPLVLIPREKNCCGLHLKIDPRSSSPLVYTQQGTLIGAMPCFMKFVRYAMLNTITAIRKKKIVHAFIIVHVSMTNFFKCQVVLFSRKNYCTILPIT